MTSPECHPVTIGLMVSLYGWAMACKPKKNNGSPGRARTADLVINSSRLTLFMGQ